MVDFLIYDPYRKAGVRLTGRFRFGEVAASELVSTMDQGPSNDPVDLDVATTGNLRAAPRAAG